MVGAGGVSFCLTQNFELIHANFFSLILPFFQRITENNFTFKESRDVNVHTLPIYFIFVKKNCHFNILNIEICLKHFYTFLLFWSVYFILFLSLYDIVCSGIVSIHFQFCFTILSILYLAIVCFHTVFSFLQWILCFYRQ